MQPLTIPKDQLDTLRTNPDFAFTYKACRCQKCHNLFQFMIVKLGSRADQQHDYWHLPIVNIVTNLFETAAMALFKSYPKARLRLEKVHFDELYNGKTVILAGRCPFCQTELTVMLTKQ